MRCHFYFVVPCVFAVMLSAKFHFKVCFLIEVPSYHGQRKIAAVPDYKNKIITSRSIKEFVELASMWRHNNLITRCSTCRSTKRAHNNSPQLHIIISTVNKNVHFCQQCTRKKHVPWLNLFTVAALLSAKKGETGQEVSQKVWPDYLPSNRQSGVPANFLHHADTSSTLRSNK